MSPAALVLWAALVALLVVLFLAGLRAAAAFRELRRVSARVDAYAGLPVVSALQRAEVDAARIAAALGALGSLLARARAAAAVIRRGPIPPEIVATFVTVRREFAAFRRFARR